MAEDMTYEPVTDVTALRRDRDAIMAANVTLNRRVRELEAQNAELLAAAVTNAQDMLTLRVECDGLRARLDAVPVEAMRYLHGPMPVVDGKMEESWKAIKAYLDTLPPAAQPDDNDAPLTLADIDGEDGDL